MDFNIPVEWLERIERKIDAQGNELRRMAAGLDVYTELLESHSKTLESRSKMLEARSVTLKARSATLEARSVTLEARSVTLEARSATLEARSVTLQAHSRTIEKHSEELLRLGGGLPSGQDPSTSHWSVDALRNFDKESERRVAILEQIHQDLQFIIGEIRRIQARMDYGFALIIARLDAAAATNRRFLRSLDAHERRLSRRPRHRIH
jgi:hypothetical protein